MKIIFIFLSFVLFLRLKVIFDSLSVIKLKGIIV